MRTGNNKAIAAAQSSDFQTAVAKAVANAEASVVSTGTPWLFLELIINPCCLHAADSLLSKLCICISSADPRLKPEILLLGMLFHAHIAPWPQTHM